MGILSDWQIERDIKITGAQKYDRDAQLGKISYGYTSYGYDARLGYKFWIFDEISCGVIDPKKFDKKMLREVETKFDETLIIPPRSCVLGETIEEFELPRDVLCVVLGKSTYARTGLVVNVTPGEPEWKGRWTIELSNTSPLPVMLYPGEGIMQCLFFRNDGRDEQTGSVLNMLLSGKYLNSTLREMLNEDVTCRTSYADKKGKYQNQTGLTAPSVTKKEE